MSLAAMHWARQSLKTAPDKIKAPARLALMLLADYADEQHASWPSITTMALEMGCSPRSVQRSIDLLASHGFVQVETRHASNGRQMSNRYHLAVDGRYPVGRQSGTPSMSDHSGEGDNLTPSEGDRLTGEGVTRDRGRVTPVSPLDSTTRTLPPTPSHSRADEIAASSEPEHAPADVFQRAQGQTDDGQALETLPRTAPIDLDWEPDLETWRRACFDRGLPEDAEVSQALIDFREHYAAQPGRRMTAADWTRRFARWVTENTKRTTPTPGGQDHGRHRRERTPARRLTAAEARQQARERDQGSGPVYDGEAIGRP